MKDIMIGLVCTAIVVILDMVLTIKEYGALKKSKKPDTEKSDTVNMDLGDWLFLRLLRVGLMAFVVYTYIARLRIALG